MALRDSFVNAVDRVRRQRMAMAGRSRRGAMPTAAVAIVMAWAMMPMVSAQPPLAPGFPPPPPAPADQGAVGAVAAPPAATPTGFLLVGLAASTRFLLPAIVLVALGSLIGGALLLFGPGTAPRRRRGDA